MKHLVNLPKLRPRRLGLLATCLLPAAFGVGMRTPHTGFLATHTFACPGSGSGVAPSSYTGRDELTRYAEGAARQMGGDAIIDVRLDDAASVQPKAGEQGMLYLSGSVVRWQ